MDIEVQGLRQTKEIAVTASERNEQLEEKIKVSLCGYRTVYCTLPRNSSGGSVNTLGTTLILIL